MRALASSRVVLAALLSLGALACVHDVDKLKDPTGGSGTAGTGASGSGSAGSGASGTGGSSGTSGTSGSGGTGGGAAGDGTGGPVSDGGIESCAPCADPDPILGGKVLPEACCTGTRGDLCGVRFPMGDRCFVKNVAGPADTTCPDAMREGVAFPGCCRPDGQCGIVVEQLGLGCVLRQDAPEALGGPLSERSCVPKCTDDDECKAFSDDLVCAEDDTHTAGARYCARFCQRDRDCEDLDKHVCAIQYNKTEDTIDFICRRPIGTGEQGDPCSHAEDCEHGACAKKTVDGTAMQYCTQLCGGETDCGSDTLMCSTTNIPTPSSTVAMPKAQPVRICALK
jgi:hypothetical protein